MPAMSLAAETATATITNTAVMINSPMVVATHEKHLFSAVEWADIDVNWPNESIFCSKRPQKNKVDGGSRTRVTRTTT